MLISECKCRLKEDVIYNLVNDTNVNEMFLWMNHVRTRKKRKRKMKDFLLGRIFNFNVQDIDLEYEADGMKIHLEKKVELMINCSLEYEKRRKFKFKIKFKDREIGNRLLQLKEIFIISKNLERKLSIRNEQRNEFETEFNEKEDVFSWKYFC